ncbi:MAG: hypothetical protein ACHP7O_07920, partial [Burkholderiales bacterium]
MIQKAFATDGMKSTDEGPIVRHFSEILLWPLQLGVAGTKDRSGVFDDAVRLLESDSSWKPLDDRYFRADNPRDDKIRESRYAEFVYFHPFVQRFLYGTKPEETNSPMRIFERKDVTAIDYRHSGAAETDAPLRLHVERLHLYLFHHAIAILVVEVSAQGIPLELAESVLDELRHAYPPYWNNWGNQQAGHCPAVVTFVDKEEKPIAASNFQDHKIHFSETEKTLRAPISAHWQTILKPLVFAEPSVASTKVT